MGEVLEFKPKSSEQNKKKSTRRRKTEQRPTVSEQKTPVPAVKSRSKKKKEAMNSESIKLWWISQEFDDLIRKAVIDKHIPAEELAAVMAHRLGTLLMVSERTPEMTLFCMKIISKITNQPHPGTNAS
jgi:ribosome-binding protein aMBF1 (putative translation factor)